MFQVNKNTRLGRIALKYKLFVFKTAEKVSLRPEQLKRVELIANGSGMIPNPVLTSEMANRIKAQMGI